MTDQLSDREARANHYFEQDLKGAARMVWEEGLGLQKLDRASWPCRHCCRCGNLILSGLHPRDLGAGSNRWTWGVGHSVRRLAADCPLRRDLGRVKRERRLYANGAGAYRDLDDDIAYLQFVENVEVIIAEEQQVYWRNRGGQDGGARQAVSTAPAQEPTHS
jgi:hypothetical protein